MSHWDLRPVIPPIVVNAVMPRFDFVVSAENNNYMVWQSMLFHYSCIRHMGQAPIVVVHKGFEPLLPGFRRIIQTGGMVQTAPDYNRVGGVNYPPRNTSASLRFVESTADYLILCDPDMVFLRSIPLEEYALSDRQISFDQLYYLDPDRATSALALDETCRLAGVPPERLRTCPIDGGVPHVVPSVLREQLSAEWLACIEMFPTIQPWPKEVAGALSRGCHIGPQKDWLATMWAVILAVHRLNLEPVMTQWCISNYEGGKELESVAVSGQSMIHYCYRDSGFDKTSFDSEEAAEKQVWQVPPDDGTVSGAVRRQLHEARAFFSLNC